MNGNKDDNRRTEPIKLPETEQYDPDNPPPDGLNPVNPPVTE